MVIIFKSLIPKIFKEIDKNNLLLDKDQEMMEKFMECFHMR